MADNTTYTPGSGLTIATDDISSVHYPRTKIGWGVDGVYNDASGTNPLPVSVSGTITTTGGLTDTQLRATAVPVSLSSLPALATGANVIGAITQSGAWNVGVTGNVEITNDAGNAIPVSAVNLPLPSGAATETTLAAINTKTPALGQTTKSASQPVTLASDQGALSVSVDTELIETLQSVRMAMELLAAQSSRFMPDVSGRNRVAIESGGVTISSGTVTTVTTVSTLSNQTSMGGIAANPQIPALMTLTADNLRRNITVS
jgi:hypothetical protein